MLSFRFSVKNFNDHFELNVIVFNLVKKGVKGEEPHRQLIGIGQGGPEKAIDVILSYIDNFTKNQYLQTGRCEKCVGKEIQNVLEYYYWVSMPRFVRFHKESDF